MRVAEAQEIAKTFEIITTDNEGNAYTQKGLPYGKYVIKETFTPRDYESVRDITFRITQDESEISEIAKKVKTIVANDEQMETYIKLIKKDLKTGKNVTLNSTTFQIIPTEDVYDRATGVILHQKGKPVMQKVGSTIFDTFTTNADNLVVPVKSYNNSREEKGTITMPLTLEVGSYKVVEVRTPEGFLILDNPVYFDVDGIRDYDVDNDGDFIQEVIVKNEQPTGRIKLDKFIVLRSNVDTSLVDTSNLSKIQFTLTADEDIIDYADGGVIYQTGQIVGVYTLDKKGYAVINEIPMGSYYLQEIKTLDGLVLSRDRHQIKFAKEDDTTKIYEEIQKIGNDTTLVEISKTDVTGTKELVGAKLKITDDTGKIIDEWFSNGKTHKMEGLLVGKTYTLTEEIAPDGYVRASAIQFTVKNTSEVQKVQMIDKVVTLTKSDIAGNEIEGAKLKVTDKNGNIVDEWVSTKESHNIKGLEENKSYVLHEEYAPDGYVIASDIEFFITTDKETQKEVMVDKIVEITKQDVAGEEIVGATLQVIDKDGKIVDEWVSSKIPHKVKGLIETESYTLHEEITADGYVKASDIKFTVSKDKETQKITMIDKVLEIIKTDLVTGDEIEGALLKVVDENDNIIDEWVSTKVPHKVNGLEENKNYKLIEITAPYGYEIAEIIEFTVTQDKETQKVEMKDMPILRNVKVIKVDNKTKDIITKDFSFGIYEDEQCTKLIAEVDGNAEDGTVMFEDLRFGNYFIKETKAPVGYILSDKVVKVESNENGIFADEVELTENDKVYSFEYTNDKIETANTGDDRNIMLSVLGIISSIIGIAVLTFLRIRKSY